MSITYVWWKNHQSNQHQSTFNRIPLTLHCHAPCPMSLTHAHWGSNSPNLDPPSISVADGFQSQQPARSRGKLWSKISILLILTRKIRPEARDFAFARAGGCDDLNHLRFAPVWIVWVVWIASRSVSISQRLPKGREVRLIGLGLTNFTIFKTDQNRTICNIVGICQDMSRYVEICQDDIPDTIWYHLIPALISNLWE